LNGELDVHLVVTGKKGFPAKAITTADTIKKSLWAAFIDGHNQNFKP
jgi:hypothetical protein